jgi:hypothetical protein
MSRIAILCIVLIGFGSPANARTWRVEKDGSGDFTVIQAAVDAAAPGDTILIGPGRFTEKAPLVCPGWTEDVYVAVLKDNLTVIGAGEGLTVVGPATREYADPEVPKGFAIIGTARFQLSEATVENTRDGLYCSGGFIGVSMSTFQKCRTGLVAWSDGGMLVERCQFKDNTAEGLVTIGPTNGALVSHCQFANPMANLSFINGTSGAVADSCEFRGGAVGVAISDYSVGQVLECRFRDLSSVAIVVAIASQAELVGNIVVGSQVNLKLDSNCHVSGSGNMLNGGTYATILNACSTMDFHGNHILNAGGYSVKFMVCGHAPDLQVDLTGNYWGTTDTATLDAWIWDSHDEPAVYAIANYEPFSPIPLPTEKKSLGGVKSLYR